MGARSVRSKPAVCRLDVDRREAEWARPAPTTAGDRLFLRYARGVPASRITTMLIVLILASSMLSGMVVEARFGQ